MPPAARVGDTTSHPGTITGPGVSTVLIGGLPAAVMGDMHACSFPPPPPHPPTAIVRGSLTVLINGRPAARVGDMAACGASIVMGAMDVLIGG
jgi:uncharacterized Zn-binding protein involved in type VI secretion